MSRWRIAVVAALLSVPLVAWAAIGTYYLWREGWALVGEMYDDGGFSGVTMERPGSFI